MQKSTESIQRVGTVRTLSTAPERAAFPRTSMSTRHPRKSEIKTKSATSNLVSHPSRAISTQKQQRTPNKKIQRSKTSMARKHEMEQRIKRQKSHQTGSANPAKTESEDKSSSKTVMTPKWCFQSDDKPVLCFPFRPLHLCLRTSIR